MPERPWLLIVSGESSGELYGALLAGRLRALLPGLHMAGVGGERMRAAGVEVFREVSGAFGLSEAAGHLRDLKATFEEIIKRVRPEPPGLAVLIDFPDFNFRLGRELKKRGIKVLYYVSPQVWAWRAGRVKKMARFVDKVAVILPFEEAIYRREAVPCEFVGHPVLDEVREMEEAGRDLTGIGNGKPLLALLPGSRPSELERHLPLLLDTVREIRKRGKLPGCRFFVPLAPNLDASRFGEGLRALEAEGVVIKKESALKVLSAADAALIASGTATLQAAFLGVPFAVFYRVAPLTYWLGRLILKIKYVSILNIILKKEAAREFLQSAAKPSALAEEAERLVTDASYRERLKSDFSSFEEAFGDGSASERTARLAIEIAGWSAR